MNEIWQVGDIKITRVVEMEVAGGSRFILPDATREASLAYPWLQPHFMDLEGNLIMSVHALVIDTGEHRIVEAVSNTQLRAHETVRNLEIPNLL